MHKLMLLSATIFVLSGCTQIGKTGLSGPVIPDSSCVAFHVIHPAQLDTIGTKRQVLAHNQIYRRICGSK